jgi:hypothetical protein
MRTKVVDYINKVIEDSKKDGDEDHAPSNVGQSSATGQVRFTIPANTTILTYHILLVVRSTGYI